MKKTIFDYYSVPPMMPWNLVNSGGTHLYYSSDTLKNYRRSLKQMGDSWKYKDVTIEYKINKMGYRSADIEEITDDNYFVAYGCSHTQGIGLHLDDTYCEVLSKRLGMKYLNLGQGGSSHNYLWFNALLGAKHFKFKPKFVIFQWPEITRLAIPKTDGIVDIITPIMVNKIGDLYDRKLYEAYIMNRNFINQQALGYYNSVNLLWQEKKVKTINITLDNDSNALFDIKLFPLKFDDNTLLARDLHHPGAEQNVEIADYIESCL